MENPTHVVTLAAYDVHRRRTRYLHLWVSAGPFDTEESLIEGLVSSLEVATDALEVCEDARRSSPGEPLPTPWTQLSLLD